MNNNGVSKKRLQNTYVIVICALFIIGLIVLHNVAWYQIVLSIFCFDVAGMLLVLLGQLEWDDEEEEEDRYGY